MDSYYISVCFSIAAFVFLSIISFLYFKRKTVLEIENKAFIALLFTTIILLALDFIFPFTISLTEVGARNTFLDLSHSGYIFLNDVVCKVDVFFMFLWGFLLVYYLFALTNKDLYQSNAKKFKRISTIFIISALIISIIIVFFSNINLEYRGIDTFEPYSLNGPLIYILHIFTVLESIVAITLLIKNKNKIRNLFITPLYVDFEIFIVVILIQILFSFSVNVSVSFYILTIFIAYLTIESQDNKYLFELIRSKDEAEKANKEKIDFLTNISHKIRTPMNTIIGYSESILKNISSDDNGYLRNDIKSISNANDDLNVLVNNLLDISNIENKYEVVYQRNYKLYDLFQRVYVFAKKNIASEKIKFSIEINPSMPSEFIGDIDKLYKIIINVITNAARYTSLGEVKLSADIKPIKNDIYEFTFLIYNSGHAMPFELFVKNFDDLKDNSGMNNSINLGLIIAKELVTLLGGKLEFSNVKGKGTRYFVRVRQKAISTAPIGNITSFSDTIGTFIDLTGKTCLVIDDSKLNLRLITKSLYDFKCKVVWAENGFDAVEKFKKGKFDFILLDKNMPDFDGIQTLKSLYSTGFRVPPVIELITNKSYKNRDFEADDGFYGYLVKPFSSADLNKLLTQIYKEVKK